MALVGAYMMAGALATNAEPSKAFKTYEAATRPLRGGEPGARERRVDHGGAYRLLGALGPQQHNQIGASAQPSRHSGPTRRSYEALVLPDFDSNPVSVIQ